MIVAPVSDPLLQRALRRAARPDEDVVWAPELVDEALHRGFPRLVVHLERGQVMAAGKESPPAPVLRLSAARLQAWERERRRVAEAPASRVDFLAVRLGLLVRDHASRSVWVDRALADVARAAGAPLPPAFRGFARRVLEFPSHYADLGALEALTGLSRGALKARFRRRDLESPTCWLRRLRVLAAAHVLADPSVTVLRAAYGLGFSDSGNFCRLIQDACDTTPTRIREPAGRARLVVELATDLARPGAWRAWETLGAVFLEEAA